MPFIYAQLEMSTQTLTTSWSNSMLNSCFNAYVCMCVCMYVCLCLCLSWGVCTCMDGWMDEYKTIFHPSAVLILTHSLSLCLPPSILHSMLHTNLTFAIDFSQPPIGWLPPISIILLLILMQLLSIPIFHLFHCVFSYCRASVLFCCCSCV